MKNFRILIEDIQGILVESNRKPFLKLYQDLFFKAHGIVDYASMSEFKKGQYREYIKKEQDYLDSKLDQFDSFTQSWIGRIFSKGEQVYPEDMNKVVGMVRDFNSLKKKGLLSKQDANLGKHNFSSLMQLLSSQEGGITDYGENQIIHKVGEWKIIQLANYEKSMVLIGNNKNSWCIKHRENFEDTYQPPFYAFYLSDEPYALFDVHRRAGGIFLKNVSDGAFGDLGEDGFNECLKWLLVKHLKFGDGDLDKFSKLDDLKVFISKDEEYTTLFSEGRLRELAKSNHWMQIYYSLLKDHEIKDDVDLFYKSLCNHDEATCLGILERGNWEQISSDRHFLVSMFKMVIQYGSLDFIKKCLAKRDLFYSQEWMLYECLYEFAIIYDRVDLVNHLLGVPEFYKLVDLNKYGMNGKYTLKVCLEHNQIDMLKLLMKQEEVDLNFGDVGDDNGNILLFAIKWNNRRRIKLIMEYMDRIDLSYTWDDDTIFDLIVKNKDLRLFEQIIKYATPDNFRQVNKYGKTILMDICYYGRKDFLLALEKYMDKIDLHQIEHGRTVFDWAEEGSHMHGKDILNILNSFVKKK